MVGDICPAQNRIIDSLLSRLKTDKEDTNKVLRLKELCWEYKNQGKYDSAMIFGTKAVDLAKKLNYKRGLSASYNNIGTLYIEKGLYPKTLEYFFMALKIKEELNDKKGISGMLINIGNVHLHLLDEEKAMDYYIKGLKIAEEVGYKPWQANALGNIGNIYGNKGNYQKALEYYSKTLTIYEGLGNKTAIAAGYGNMGIAYRKLGDYSKAMEFYQKALNLFQELGNKTNIASNYGNIGLLHLKQKHYVEAELNLLKGLELGRELKVLGIQKMDHQALSDLYSETGQFKKAFEHYKEYVALNDKITNEANTKKQTEIEMQYLFEKEQLADSIKNMETVAREKLKHEQEIKQQRIYTYGGIIGFVLMLVVAGISFRGYRQKQKANLIITEQKKMVEEKQKEILDSIHYAQRIQKALLPNEKYISKNLNKLYPN